MPTSEQNEVIIYKAPAKLNLFLDIISRRKDGYHNILSLMVKIDLRDELEISQSRARTIDLKVEGDAPQGADNICFKTAELMLKKYNIVSGLKIKLRKFIPKESGLGGASSDAAFVIRGINKIFNLGLPRQEMFNLASEIGSDVPFFISDSIWAVVSSKGEVVRDIKPDFDFNALLVIPDFRVNTKEAYSKWRPSLTEVGYLDKIKFCSSEDISFNFLEKYSYNIFEKVIQNEELSKIKKVLKSLKAGIIGLSGTGSAIYVLFSKRKEAMPAERKLRSLSYRVFEVKPLKSFRSVQPESEKYFHFQPGLANH